MEDNGTIRKFDTGATRDTSANKNDYEGFLSPLVIEAFGDYMNENRVQKDGSLRSSDNWQKGIPKDVYMKSGWRHFMQWWKLHRGHVCKDENGKPVDLKHAICGLLFNVMGYLHEDLKAEALANTKLEPGELKSILSKVPEPPKFPRFFYRADAGSCGTVFVIMSEHVGGSVLLSQLRNPEGPWGSCNWALWEMTDGSWSNNPPVEISAAEAVRRGLPRCTDDWPLNLRSSFVGGRSYHICGEEAK